MSATSLSRAASSDSLLARVPELCCPACHGDLAEDGAREPELRCVRCDRGYPVLLGIPDLRLFPDPYIGMEADRAKARKVAERWDDLDFRGLVEFYYSMTEVVTKEQARSFTAGLLGAVARAEAALGGWEASWARAHGTGGLPNGALLDLGCGTGPMLVAARGRVRRAVGVDIAFRWLAVGKKRLAEAGVDAPLVCACAEALPFRDASFGLVTADAVIDNVDDPARALAESHRVLAPRGRVYLSVQNKRSIAPDPQTGIVAVGWRSPASVEARVKAAGGIPPKRHLLSSGDLTRLMTTAGFARPTLSLPTFPAGQRAHFSPFMQRIVDVYHLAARLPLSKQVLLVLGPKLNAVAEKGAGSGERGAAVTPSAGSRA